jgi:hypothetical protein
MRLELAVDEELEPVEEKLKSRLLNIVRELQLKRFQIYQQSRGLSQAVAEEGHGDTILPTITNDVEEEVAGSPKAGTRALPPELDLNLDFPYFFQLGSRPAEWPSDLAPGSMLQAWSRKTAQDYKASQTSVDSQFLSQAVNLPN